MPPRLHYVRRPGFWYFDLANHRRVRVPRAIAHELDDRDDAETWASGYMARMAEESA